MATIYEQSVIQCCIHVFPDFAYEDGDSDTRLKGGGFVNVSIYQLKIHRKFNIASLKMTVLGAPKELEALVGLFGKLYVSTFDCVTFYSPRELLYKTGKIRL